MAQQHRLTTQGDSGSMDAAVGPALLDAIIDRVGRTDWQRFEAQLRSSGYCARPVRLQGRIDVCDGYGRRRVWSTDGEPDGILRKACGNRREAVARRVRSATAATPTT